VRNNTFLNSRVQGRRSYGFGGKVGDVINRVFSERFIGGGRENIKKLKIIVRGIHDNCGVSFIFF